jgi:hypothetical protein
MTRGEGLRMTGNEGLGMIPLFCHCEPGFVSRGNLVEGHRIAAHLLGGRNDIRDFSLVLHGTEGCTREFGGEEFPGYSRQI